MIQRASFFKNKGRLRSFAPVLKWLMYPPEYHRLFRFSQTGRHGKNTVNSVWCINE